MAQNLFDALSNLPIEVDEDVDGNFEPEDDSSLNWNYPRGGTRSGTTSISSTVYNYRYENNRRYHGFRDGAYFLPNDKPEQERMDLVHRIYRLLLNGKLYCAPLEGSPERVLDLGCGTGVWAIDFAQQHPKSQVLGTDLSPIQKLWIPRNCSFEIDDFEDEWQYDESRIFDYIHTRDLAGSISDYTRFFTQAYKNLRPGGYIEMQSFEADFFSSDGTRERAVTATLWQKLLIDASKRFGKSLAVEDSWAEQMVGAGFVDVVEEVYQVPFSPWPEDAKAKEIGRYQESNLQEALESYSLALFTRILGWSMEELDVLFQAVRNDFADPQTHLYGKVRFIYGRKPI